MIIEFLHTLRAFTLTSSISHLFIKYFREIKALQEIEDNQNVSKTFYFAVIALFLVTINTINF